MNQPTYAYDVVVIGAGPHGLAYASWIKRWRPETSIAVVDKATTPGYKIGESLLSTATRSFIAMGLSLPMLRRLFGNKAGIRFWWTGTATDRLHRHVDVVDIEETFQVERRVLDMALQEAVRRQGVDLYTGVRVNLTKSDVDGELKRITCEGPDGPFTLSTRVLCDASGPASVLARHKKLYRKAPERLQTFTTHSYFAYFKQKKNVPVPHWDEPATRHICFPGGWMWFINLTSWDQTPDDNLREMVRYLLDRGDAPDAAMPSRRELAERFGGETEPVVSIGFTIRADQDTTKGLSVAERFQHYVEKHPAVAWVLDHYELIPDAYGHKSPYHAFCNLVHDCEQYAGNGWCIIGDAAAFTNPLFSPGLNLGSGTSYMAARDTVDALNEGTLTRSAFARYEKYVQDIYTAVLSETDLYYRAFNHVDSFEWALLLKLFYGAADVIERDTVYSPTDPYVHDLLNPRFREHVDRARAILREGEETGEDPAVVAPRVRAVIEPFVKEVLAQPHVRALNLGSVFNQYTSDGERVEKKVRHRPELGFHKCEECRNYMDNSLTCCPVCGTPSTYHRTKSERRAA